MAHAVVTRTSAAGEPFRGRCDVCGAEDLTELSMRIGRCRPVTPASLVDAVLKGIRGDGK